jgi:D-arabinose 1-dehydrogenase-like Zn-dependent alcohol dehydrogenase
MWWRTASRSAGLSSARAKTWRKRSHSPSTARVKADIELQPLSAIDTVFERLTHGDVPSRVVIDFTSN